MLRGAVATSLAAAMSLLALSVAAAVFVYVAVFYGVFRGSKCYSPVRLDGKTAIVTGNGAANTLASFWLLRAHVNGRRIGASRKYVPPSARPP